MADFTLDSLLNLEPSKVSKDLRTYITYVYGQAGVGKTTLAKDMGSLILSCEDGTRAMSGAYNQIMKNWSDIKTICRFAKDPKMKERYKGIAVDTIDIAASYCEKYVCSQNGIKTISELPWGQGYALLKKEFEETFQELAREGYAILFISHDKEKAFKRPDGTEYTKIVPTLPESMNNIIKNMADIIVYGYQEFGTDDRYMILRSDGSIEAKSRFPYMERKIKFGYQELEDALKRAVEKEEEINGSDAVTSERTNGNNSINLDYDDLMLRFNAKVASLMEKDKAHYGPIIQEIVDGELMGKKFSECTRAQVEPMSVIVDKIEALN